MKEKKRCFLDFFQKSGYNLLTKRKKDVILYKVFARKRKNKIKWPVGQAVKTPPFHGGNMGSSPVGVTKK